MTVGTTPAFEIFRLVVAAGVHGPKCGDDTSWWKIKGRI